MKKIIIDTNVLISFITDRDLEQQKMASVLFYGASQYKYLILCPQNVLTEFIFVMDKVYNSSLEKINEILNDFISMPGIEVIHDLDLQLVLSYWPKYFSDFGDAIVASVCKGIKGTSVATFDRKFKNALKKADIEIQSF
ncbi:MAG: PIN domain-containing protein [Deltaproteobacteria bacterium]|nr:PIN domain-containing protein [Deltaproteobacteria bacterium]